MSGELFISSHGGDAFFLTYFLQIFSPWLINSKPGTESTMPSLQTNWGRLALGLVLCVAIALVRAESAKNEAFDEVTLGPPLSLEELDERLQVYLPVSRSSFKGVRQEN